MSTLNTLNQLFTGLRNSTELRESIKSLNPFAGMKVNEDEEASELLSEFTQEPDEAEAESLRASVENTEKLKQEIAAEPQESRLSALAHKGQELSQGLIAKAKSLYDEAVQNGDKKSQRQFGTWLKETTVNTVKHPPLELIASAAALAAKPKSLSRRIGFAGSVLSTFLKNAKKVEEPTPPFKQFQKVATDAALGFGGIVATMLAEKKEKR